ncbi:MAG: hypothetical protein M3096_03580 [Actinomycetia bacterium]|nr:hypothetical protein [Actinomycetes bacterium]
MALLVVAGMSACGDGGANDSSTTVPDAIANQTTEASGGTIADDATVGLSYPIVDTGQVLFYDDEDGSPSQRMVQLSLARMLPTTAPRPPIRTTVTARSRTTSQG